MVNYLCLYCFLFAHVKNKCNVHTKIHFYSISETSWVNYCTAAIMKNRRILDAKLVYMNGAKMIIYITIRFFTSYIFLNLSFSCNNIQHESGIRRSPFFVLCWFSLLFFVSCFGNICYMCTSICNSMLWIMPVCGCVETLGSRLKWIGNYIDWNLRLTTCQINFRQNKIALFKFAFALALVLYCILWYYTDRMAMMEIS